MLRLFLFRIESTLQRTKLLRRLSPSSVARCIATNNFTLANEILSKFFSPLNISLYIDPSIRSDEVVHLINSDKGNVIFALGSNAISANKPLFTRLFALRHLIITYHETNFASSKTIKVHLGDNPFGDGMLVFGANNNNNIKIPDPDFLSSYGYRDLKSYFATNNVNWNSRLPIVFWRGSTTGIVSNGDWKELPRIRLCKHVKESSLSNLFDVGISNVVQFDKSIEREILQSGLMRPYASYRDLNKFKYHLDIDGNSNAWSGLFSKLLSGGLVFKIDSGYSQWYYDRLLPWKHYIPISTDFNDLLDKVQWALNHDDMASRIAYAGFEFALNIDFTKEIQLTINKIAMHNAAIE